MKIGYLTRVQLLTKASKGFAFADATVDHRADAAVAERKGLFPKAGRLVVSKCVHVVLLVK